MPKPNPQNRTRRAVANPRRARALQPNSVTDRLAKLEVGDTESRVELVEHAADTLEAKRILTNRVTPSIGRVRERFPDRRFEIETGAFISSAHEVYSICVVRRVA